MDLRSSNVSGWLTAGRVTWKLLGELEVCILSRAEEKEDMGRIYAGQRQAEGWWVGGDEGAKNVNAGFVGGSVSRPAAAFLFGQQMAASAE